MTRSDSSLEELKERLKGVLGFPVTPFAEDGSVDGEGVRENAQWLSESGVSALVTPSGTGELFALSPDECKSLTQETVEAVQGRIPVIAGVGFGPHVGAELAQFAEEVGASAILVLPPYYGSPDREGLISYYSQIAESTSLGVILYARSPATFTPGLLVELADRLPNLVAFKDGTADVRLFQRIHQYSSERLGSKRLLWLCGAGDDLVAPYFSVGAQGFTSSLACFWPEVAVDLYDAAISSNWPLVGELQERLVRPIYELRTRRAGFEVSVMKAAMQLLGYRAGHPRPPLGRLSGADLHDLERILDELKVPTASHRLGAARTRAVVGAPGEQIA